VRDLEQGATSVRQRANGADDPKERSGNCRIFFARASRGGLNFAQSIEYRLGLGNPKSEARNPKQIRSTKSPIPNKY
jgi:hypothetical protein